MPAHIWTEADDQQIRDHYATEQVDQLAARLGITRQQLYWRARKKLRLSKPHSGGGRGRPSPKASPVGTVRKSANYLFVKVSKGAWPEAWRQLHHVVWEAEHGPIPAGHVLSFKDGNVENVDPDNLELFSKAEWVALRVHVEGRLPPEVAEVIRIKAILTRTINQRHKEQPNDQ